MSGEDPDKKVPEPEQQSGKAASTGGAPRPGGGSVPPGRGRLDDEAPPNVPDDIFDAPLSPRGTDGPPDQQSDADRPATSTGGGRKLAPPPKPRSLRPGPPEKQASSDVTTEAGASASVATPKPPPVGSTLSKPPLAGRTLSKPSTADKTPSKPPTAGETLSKPPTAGKTPSIPPRADKTPSIPPAAGKTPSVPPAAGKKTPSIAPVAGKTPSTPPRADKIPSIAPVAGKTPSVPPAATAKPSPQPPRPDRTSSSPPATNGKGSKPPRKLAPPPRPSMDSTDSSVPAETTDLDAALAEVEEAAQSERKARSKPPPSSQLSQRAAGDAEFPAPPKPASAATERSTAPQSGDDGQEDSDDDDDDDAGVADGILMAPVAGVEEFDPETQPAGEGSATSSKPEPPRPTPSRKKPLPKPLPSPSQLSIPDDAVPKQAQPSDSRAVMAMRIISVGSSGADDEAPPEILEDLDLVAEGSAEPPPSDAEPAELIEEEESAALLEVADVQLDSVKPPPKPVQVEAAPDSTEEADELDAVDAEPVSSDPDAKRPPPPPRRPTPPPSSTDALKKRAARKRKPDKPKREAKPIRPQRRPWWEELFSEDFARAHAPLKPRQIVSEVDFIEKSLGVAPGGIVLDLGCGQGHHAVELASRGYGVVGYDLSLYQLALAADVAQEAGQKLNFLQGDMREMAFEEMFDGIYCWNATFGYFEEEKNLAVAERMFRALRPGGAVLLDVTNRDFTLVNQPSSVWYEGDSCVCMDDMTVDFITSRMKVKRSLILDDGRTKETYYSIRIYALHEIGKLLHDVGFRVTQASGDPVTPGKFFGERSPRIIVLARKP